MPCLDVLLYMTASVLCYVCYDLFFYQPVWSKTQGYSDNAIFDFVLQANNSTLLDELVTNYLDNVESAQTLHQYGKYEVLDIYSHEVVSKPKQNLQKLCDFLQVTGDEDYLDASSELLFPKPSFTRHSLYGLTSRKAEFHI